MHHDELSRFICESLGLRVYTATTLKTVREITSLHGTTPNATVALGRAITASTLLGAMLKPESDQSLLLKIEGGGPVREIHVQVDARGNIRGYAANPQPDITDDIGSINFSRAIGAGFLTIRKDTGIAEPYSSVIPLHDGEIAGDVARYLAASEQIPSALIIALTLGYDGVVSSSGGILIQTYPGTPETAILKVENAIASMKRPLGDRLRGGEPVESIFCELFDDEPVSRLGSHSLRASCRCDRGFIMEIISRIGIEELKDMRERDRGAEVTCAFCAKHYLFSEDDLSGIIGEKELAHEGRDFTGKPENH